MNKVTWGIVAVILIVLGVWWAKGSHTAAPAADNSPIKIGFIAPLTGDAASYGEPVKNSVQLAVDEVNKNGGIKGRQIQMIYEDGKCTGQDAASAAQKLVNVDGVKYIIAGGCSGEVFAEIPITEPAKVFVIAPLASAAKLSGISPLFVRNNPSDAITGVLLADRVATKYKTVAVISEQTDYAQGIKDVFVSEAQKKGLTIADTEDFASSITDFRSQVTKIQAKNPDVIFVNPQTPQAFVRIITQARQLGVKAPFVGVLFGSDAKIQGAGAPADGIEFVDLGSLSGTKGAEFTQKYKDAYHADMDYALYDGAGYDDVYILSQAISTVGDDSTKVAQYVRSLPSFEGTLGSYHFDDKGDIVGAGLVLQKISGGKLVDIQ